ncbi:MAG: hypothetical protein U5K79_02720 [Cyclobacteriaceae bacterium]|nr:hypothetical protein [Cyclobacteriaceae bacterium]
MTLAAFKAACNSLTPPSDISDELLALWYDARGNWNRAHELVQETGGFTGDWIHAYLHRKEGDDSNAAYWYRRVKKTMPQKSLSEEWDELAAYILKSESIM